MKKFCENCGKELKEGSTVCLNCGKYVRNKQKTKFPVWAIILISFAAIGFIAVIFSSDTGSSNLKNDNSNNQSNNQTNNDNNNNNQKPNNKEEQKKPEKIDKSQIIYQDDNFLVKITDYKRKPITNTIVIYFYIENNSDIDTNFRTDSNVSLDGYMANGGYFYETVKAHTKTNATMNIYNLDNNKEIDVDTVKEMKFNFEIYQSENYLITNRILEKEEFTYTLK